MLYEWDVRKNRANKAKHGVGFAVIEDFEWETALHALDDRQGYGEARCVAVGYIGGRLFICVYTDRGTKRRIISLRKANVREVRIYEKAKETFD